MSWHRSGVRKATVGSRSQSVPSAEAGRLVVAPGRLVKFTQGLCLRAYRPAVHTVEPARGSASA